jgi:hypothetical protein
MFNTTGYKIITQDGINPILSWKFKLFDICTFGINKDTKYKQFVFVASKY